MDDRDSCGVIGKADSYSITLTVDIHSLALIASCFKGEHYWISNCRGPGNRNIEKHSEPEANGRFEEMVFHICRVDVT